tara:strand:+ start:12959 stop:13087 length:129 start_codon:yes stop_codon:yes gene_type:complete
MTILDKIMIALSIFFAIYFAYTGQWIATIVMIALVATNISKE